jgi:hypothetical protein
MHIKICRDATVDLVEEPRKLLRPMPRLTSPEDFASLRIRAVKSNTVPWHTLSCVPCSTQPSLIGNIGGVRPMAWIEVKADNVAHLLDALRIARQVERLDPMRLQPERPPHSTRRSLAQAELPRERAGTPVRRILMAAIRGWYGSPSRRRPPRSSAVRRRTAHPTARRFASEKRAGARRQYDAGTKSRRRRVHSRSVACFSSLNTT